MLMQYFSLFRSVCNEASDSFKEMCKAHSKTWNNMHFIAHLFLFILFKMALAILASKLMKWSIYLYNISIQLKDKLSLKDFQTFIRFINEKFNFCKIRKMYSFIIYFYLSIAINDVWVIISHTVWFHFSFCLICCKAL